MQSISIRPAKMADVVEIADIHIASWRDAYASILDPAFLSEPIEADRLALWTNRFEQVPPNQIIKVAETQDGLVAGFVCAYRDHDDHWGSWIDNLHILPSLRGCKIGELLLRSVGDQLEQDTNRGLYLWVFEANKQALRFYERLGGKVVGRDRSRIPAAGGKTILRVHWAAGGALRLKD